MGLFNRFNRLKREEVVDAIVSLQREEEALENIIMSATDNINKLMRKGKAEKDTQTRLFIAKKINFVKEEKQQAIEKATYLLYNIKLLERLKTAIDDKTFYKSSTKIPLNKMLKDQRGLAKFLNKALGTRIQSENIFTAADDTYNEVMSTYDANEQIYGVQQSDDALLAMFETADAADVDFGKDEEVEEVETKEKEANSEEM